MFTASYNLGPPPAAVRQAQPRCCQSLMLLQGSRVDWVRLIRRFVEALWRLLPRTTFAERFDRLSPEEQIEHLARRRMWG